MIELAGYEDSRLARRQTLGFTAGYIKIAETQMRALSAKLAECLTAEPLVNDQLREPISRKLTDDRNVGPAD